jgi:hypothetical protein
MNVPGHYPNELWQKARGSRGTGAWTTAHVGEVIEIREGMPENTGKCVSPGRTSSNCSLDDRARCSFIAFLYEHPLGSATVFPLTK